MFDVNVLVALIAGAASVASAAITFVLNGPSKTKLLKDIELYKAMREIGTFPFEDGDMILLRVRINKQFHLIEYPYEEKLKSMRRLVAILAGLVTGCVSLATTCYFGQSLFVFGANTAFGLLLGLASGIVFSHVYQRWLERDLADVEAFAAKLSDELEDGKAENGKDGRIEDEVDGEQSYGDQ